MKRYKKDLKRQNERTDYRMCRACKARPGLVWRRSGLLCYDCDKASRPVVLDGDTVAAALMVEEPSAPVVTAKIAIAALLRSQEKTR